VRSTISAINTISSSTGSSRVSSTISSISRESSTGSSTISAISRESSTTSHPSHGAIKIHYKIKTLRKPPHHSDLSLQHLHALGVCLRAAGPSVCTCRSVYMELFCSAVALQPLTILVYSAAGNTEVQFLLMLLVVY